MSKLKPLMKWEKFSTGSWVLAQALETMTCPFLKKDGCSIYEERPIMCRLFGAVDHRDMKCPMGCGPKKLISEADSIRLIRNAA